MCDTWAQLKMEAHMSILLHHVSTAGQALFRVNWWRWSADMVALFPAKIEGWFQSDWRLSQSRLQGRSYHWGNRGSCLGPKWELDKRKCPKIAQIELLALIITPGLRKHTVVMPLALDSHVGLLSALPVSCKKRSSQSSSWLTRRPALCIAS